MVALSLGPRTICRLCRRWDRGWALRNVQPLRSKCRHIRPRRDGTCRKARRRLRTILYFRGGAADGPIVAVGGPFCRQSGDSANRGAIGSKAAGCQCVEKLLALRSSTVDSYTRCGMNDKWTLVGQVSEGGRCRAIVLRTMPFRVGRRCDLPLCLGQQTVSSCHAEFFFEGTALYLRNLNSRNGTYVNGERLVSPIEVRNEDLIQFADMPFRLSQHSVRG